MGTAEGMTVRITASLSYSSFSLGTSLLLFPLCPSIPFLPFSFSSAYFPCALLYFLPSLSSINNKNISKTSFIIHNLLKQFFKVPGGQTPKHRVDSHVWDPAHSRVSPHMYVGTRV